MMRIPYNEIIETRELYDELKKKHDPISIAGRLYYRITARRLIRVIEKVNETADPYIRKNDIFAFASFMDICGVDELITLTCMRFGPNRVRLTVSDDTMTVELDTTRDSGTNAFYMSTQENTTKYRVERQEITELKITSKFGIRVYNAMMQYIKEYLRG